MQTFAHFRTTTPYRLILAGGERCYSSNTIDVPQKVVRTARENAPTPEAAIEALTKYSDRKEAGAAQHAGQPGDLVSGTGAAKEAACMARRRASRRGAIVKPIIG